MLSAQQITQVRAAVTQEGGWEGFLAAAFAAVATDRRDVALSALSTAVTVTVNDWATLGAYIAAVKDNAALRPVLADIQAAAAAKDASKLGPLFVALYAANQKHFGA